MNKFIEIRQGVFPNQINSKVKFTIAGNENLIEKKTVDVTITEKEQLIITNCDNEYVNGLYIKIDIINGKPYWFKSSSESYDKELGYHIYLSDTITNRWVISNGRKVLYEYF